MLFILGDAETERENIYCWLDERAVESIPFTRYVHMLNFIFCCNYL